MLRRGSESSEQAQAIQGMHISFLFSLWLCGRGGKEREGWIEVDCGFEWVLGRYRDKRGAKAMEEVRERIVDGDGEHGYAMLCNTSSPSKELEQQSLEKPE